MPLPMGPVRLWLQPVMRGAASIKYPWTRLYAELKLTEPVYRKTTFGKDYRAYAQAYERGEHLKFVRRDYRPSQALYSESDIFMKKRYRYNVKTEFIDADGQIYSSRHQFVSSATQLTRGQIEDIVKDRLDDIAKDYDIPSIKATLSEAWHRTGDLWD